MYCEGMTPTPQPQPQSGAILSVLAGYTRQRPAGFAPCGALFFQGGTRMNGRNRSRRTSRQTTLRTAEPPRQRQSRTRYDRQRHATRHRERGYALPWEVMHRYNLVCLSVGGCY